MMNTRHMNRGGAKSHIVAERFGQHLTGDSLLLGGTVDKGFNGETTGFVISDIATSFVDCMPTLTNNYDDNYKALQDYAGPGAVVEHFYSDNAPEYIKACKALGWCKGSSTPGQHETNGVAEARVKKVLHGGRALLEHAGFAAKWWPYATKHYCFSCNIRIVQGESSYNLRHGDGHFEGMILPFGCYIDFYPTPGRMNRRKILFRPRARRAVETPMVPYDSRLNQEGKTPKFEAKAMPGVFLGYHLEPGGKWKGDYIVANLQDFRAAKTKPAVLRVRKLFFSRNYGCVFPLKPLYDLKRRTIEAKEDPSFLFEGIEINDPNIGDDDHPIAPRSRPRANPVDEGGDDVVEDEEAAEVEAYATSISDLEVNAADTWVFNNEDKTWTYHHPHIVIDSFGPTAT